MSREEMREYNLKYRHTEKGKMKQLFRNMTNRSKLRSMVNQDFTKEEFTIWLYKNNFKELFENWKNTGFNTKLSPSVDRLNDYEPYTFDNMRLVTWEVNKQKGHDDRRNGVNNKHSKSINQIDKITGEIIDNFPSINYASRENNINRTNISNCLCGLSNSAGGYKWKYV